MENWVKWSYFVPVTRLVFVFVFLKEIIVVHPTRGKIHIVE